jgi:zinc/manganese transport system ATP-binding protein
MNRSVTLHNLTLAYRRHPAVHHVSGRFRSGDLTAIVGPNGAGKSTLLKAIAGLLPAEPGCIDLGGSRHDEIAYLPQQAAIDRSFPLDVSDAVLLGHWRHSGRFGRVQGGVREKAETALARVGLAGFGDRPIGELSAGQFQRVLFARILLQDAPLILLDEPFTALDSKTTVDLLAVIAGWRREGRTVIAVLHDFEQVRAHFPETLLLARECVAWGPTPQVMTPEHLHRANALSQQWDEHAPVCHRDDAVALR